MKGLRVSINQSLVISRAVGFLLIRQECWRDNGGGGISLTLTTVCLCQVCDLDEFPVIPVSLLLMIIIERLFH